MPDKSTSLVVLTGLSAAATGRLATRFLEREPDSLVIHHDLRDISHGVVIRRIRSQTQEHTTALELVHGCVSCTLREDLLPLLRSLAVDPPGRIIVQAHPSMEPETLCWAMDHVLVGRHTVTDDMDIEAVIAVIDPGSWLTDATCEDGLLERGISGSPTDERTVANSP